MFDVPKQQWFLDTLKEVEGKGGFDGRLWRPFPSIEGGQPTIGYGHKLTSPVVTINGEEVDLRVQPLTSAQVETLLKQDVAIAENKAAEQYTNFGNPAGKRWNDMSTLDKTMFTEIVFNVGSLAKAGTNTFNWPKLANAIKFDNKKAALDEISRTFTDKNGNKKPLTKRVNALRKAYRSAPTVPQGGAGDTFDIPDFQGDKKLQGIYALAQITRDTGVIPEGQGSQLIDPDTLKRMFADRKAQDELLKKKKEAQQKQDVQTKNDAIKPIQNNAEVAGTVTKFSEGIFQQGDTTFEVMKVK